MILTDNPLKGIMDGKCNRHVCQKEIDDRVGQYYNFSTRAWYCKECADKINYWSLQDAGYRVCLIKEEAKGQGYL